MKKIVLSFFIALIILIGPSNSENVEVFQFNEDEFKNLKVKKVKGEIKCTLGKNDKTIFFIVWIYLLFLKKQYLDKI